MNKFKILALAMAVMLIFTVSVSASADVLSLYKNKETDNTPFRVENMFPGDYIEKPYCVRVSYNGTITVHFTADIRQEPEYLKLAEVLECQVVLGNQRLYKGLLRDMANVPHTITGVNKTEDLNYKIIISLDKGVGNEYQNLSLIADFMWWTETEEDKPGGGAGGGIPPGGGNTPDKPDVPDNPDVPDLPNTPDFPHTPSVPEQDSDSTGIARGDESTFSDDVPDSSGIDESKKPTGELIKPPNTGDFKNPAIYITLICISVFAVFLILFIRKKNKNEKNRTIRRLTIALAVIIVLAVCLCITTFALIYSKVTVDENVFRTGTVKINLNNGAPIITADEFSFEPGMTVEKDFFIKNESSDAVYYKVYFENIDGDLADVLDVTITNKENGTVLYSNKARDLSVENVESDELHINERHDLMATFHFPKESGNSAQNMFLKFNMCATATQTRNNPDREF